MTVFPVSLMAMAVAPAEMASSAVMVASVSVDMVRARTSLPMARAFTRECDKHETEIIPIRRPDRRCQIVRQKMLKGLHLLIVPRVFRGEGSGRRTTLMLLPEAIT